MSDLKDFVIEDCVLKKYLGTGGDVTIPDGVTSIGDWAFYECKKLTSITIPDGVTSIGDSAFRECKSLTSITIPEGVTSIGDSVFWGCENLTSITIPDSVTSIGDMAFWWCKSLADQNGLVIVCNVVYYYCGTSESITIPDSVASIGDGAFYGCENLTSITIPNSITSIGDSAFYGCKKLTSITIPDGVTSIGYSAFDGCECLTSITIPNSVTSIGDSAFYRCKNLTSITIPDSVTSIGDLAFCWCENLTSITIPDGVTSIGGWAFDGCECLTSITIPNSVTSIGRSAFNRCSNLTSITIPDSVISIGKKVFDGCDSLHIRINNLNSLPLEYRMETALGFLKSIDEYQDSAKKTYSQYVKRNAEKMMDILIADPDLLAVVCQEKLIPAKMAPAYLQKAQDAGNPQSLALMVDYIGTKITSGEKQRVEKKKELDEEQVFDRLLARQGKEGIDGLTFVVTGSLETFKNRTEIKDFIISKGGRLASSVSVKVDYLIMNEDSTDSEKKKKAEDLGIECITEFQFNDKSGRAFVVENGSLVKYIGAGGDVTIPDSVTSIGDSAFWGCENLTSITIPDGVTSIGNSAFRGCKKLKKITIPDGVTSIGGWAFEGCKNLTSITIPTSVKNIGKSAFDGCESLRICIDDLSVLHASYKTKAVLTFLENMAKYNDSARKMYFQYVKRNAEKMMDTLIADPDLLAVVCQEKLIPAKNAPSYLQKAQDAGNPQSLALMVDYIGTKITSGEKQRVEKKKELDEEQVFDRLLMRQGKEGIDGLVFVVSGSLKTFCNRTEIKDFIISRGGRLASSVSAKVDYLIMNEDSTDSEKKKKAEDLGIECITELRFNDISGRAFQIEDGVLKKYLGSGGDVTIPDGVTSIGYSAFRGCESLTSVTIPDGVTSIGDSSFRGCESLTSITIPDGVTSIEWCAFSGCTKLASITIPDGVTSIGGWAFDGCKKLTSITIPDGVTSIGGSAFSGCTKLASITIPDGVTSIGGSAFDGCENLTSITIPDGVTSIGNSAFDGCENLTIHAPAGSYAEQYAKEHNIPFVAE